MIRRPPRSTRVRSSAASDVYKRQIYEFGPKCVVNIVVYVGHAITNTNYLSLQRFRHARTSVAQYSVLYLMCQVKTTAFSLKYLNYPEALFVMAEARPTVPLQHGIQSALSKVPERRMTQIMTQRDRLREVLIQAQRSSHSARYPRNLQSMGQASAVMVTLWRNEDLRLVLQATKRLAVHNPIPIALERRADIAGPLRLHSSLGFSRPLRQRRKACLQALYRQSDSPGDLSLHRPIRIKSGP